MVLLLQFFLSLVWTNLCWCGRSWVSYLVCPLWLWPFLVIFIRLSSVVWFFLSVLPEVSSVTMTFPWYFVLSVLCDCTVGQYWPIGRLWLVLFNHSNIYQLWGNVLLLVFVYFSLVTIMVVQLPERTETDLITGSYQTLWTVNSCSSWLYTLLCIFNGLSSFFVEVAFSGCRICLCPLWFWHFFDILFWLSSVLGYYPFFIYLLFFNFYFFYKLFSVFVVMAFSGNRI